MRRAKKKVRVLQTVWPPGPTTNPFVALQIGNLPNEVEALWFSWRRALLARYDVIHFQWPENLVRASDSRKAVTKRLALRALLMRARIQSIPIAITVHNLTPHEAMSERESKVLRLIYSSAATLITLNGSAELASYPDTRRVVIPHGDYSQRYSRRARATEIPGRITFFGAIRAYKNVPSLVAAWRDATKQIPSLSLVVAGEPYNDSMRRDLLALSSPNNSPTFDLRKLDESELVRYIERSELIVLPYTDLYNSGAVFLALTIGVPVLVPRTAATVALQGEFGERWILLYDGQLQSTDLLSALSSAREIEASSYPDMRGRDWIDIGKQYAEVYYSLAHTESACLSWLFTNEGVVG